MSVCGKDMNLPGRATWPRWCCTFCRALSSKLSHAPASGRMVRYFYFSYRKCSEQVQKRISRIVTAVPGVKITTAPRFDNCCGLHSACKAEPSQIWKARKFIQENSDNALSLREVAGAVQLSPNHFSEKFKAVTGINFADYVARLRFEKVRTLLANTDRSITEIAFGVGFQSLSQFNRVFKRLAGESPRQYRSRHLYHLADNQSGTRRLTQKSTNRSFPD